MYKPDHHEVVLGKIPSPQMKVVSSVTWEEMNAAWAVYNEDIRAKLLTTYKGDKMPMILPSMAFKGEYSASYLVPIREMTV